MPQVVVVVQLLVESSRVVRIAVTNARLGNKYRAFFTSELFGALTSMPTPAPDHRNHGPRDKWAFLLGTHLEPTESEDWCDYVSRTCFPKEVGSGKYVAMDESLQPSIPTDTPLHGGKTNQNLPPRRMPESMLSAGAKINRDRRVRGGVNKAALIREANYTIIDAKLPEYLALVGTVNRFVMARFIEYALPQLKDVKGAVIRYGTYMKARLKYFADLECVKALGSFIDAIKRGVAKRAGKPFAGGLFETMKGFFVRVCGKPSKTTNRFVGAAWQVTMGCWGYFEDRETGECFQ